MNTISEKELRALLGTHIATKRVKQRDEYEVFFENGVVLQDYKSAVAVRLNDGRKFYCPHHHYSVTTSKHLGQWGEPNTAERMKMLEDGRATMVEPTSRYCAECCSLLW